MTDVRPPRSRFGVDLDSLAELEAERRFLLRSLADLEREHAAGDLDELDYTTLRDDYTARAAAVLHAIEEGRAALPEPAPAKRRRRRTLLVATVTIAVAALAGTLAATSSGTRLPGETATGSIGSSSAQLLSQARLVQGRDILAAIKLYDEVLATDPDNAEALTYRGWLLLQTGDADLVERGEASLDRAIEVRPTYPDARAFKGIVLMRLHDDPVGASEQFRAFLANDPPPEVRGLVEAIIAEAAQAAEERTGDGAETTVAPTDTTVAPG